MVRAVLYMMVFSMLSVGLALTCLLPILVVDDVRVWMRTAMPSRARPSNPYPLAVGLVLLSLPTGVIGLWICSRSSESLSFGQLLWNPPLAFAVVANLNALALVALPRRVRISARDATALAEFGEGDAERVDPDA